MIHKLKIKDEYLNNLIAERKKSEVRLNDRDYQLGDKLEFHNPAWDGPNGKHPQCFHFKITHIHSGLGLQPGYVVLSVEAVKGSK